MTKIINEECARNLPEPTIHKVSDVNNSLREMLIWEKLCAMDIWIKLVESVRNTEDECEKKGIMKAKEIVDAYINELDEKIEQEGRIEDRDIL